MCFRRKLSDTSGKFFLISKLVSLASWKFFPICLPCFGVLAIKAEGWEIKQVNFGRNGLENAL